MKADQPEMIAIPVKEFISATKLPADIYVRLPAGRFVQIARAGEAVEMDRLLTYESKKVEFLYVRKEDYSKYVDKNITIAGILVNRKELGEGKRHGLVTAVSQAVLKEMEDLGFTEQTFNHAKAITKTTVELIEAKPALRDMFNALNQCSDEALGHSVAVSLVSVMLGQALGWSQQLVLEKLSLGGLLHDIGMKSLPKELNEKPRASMNYQELREYETHCQRGVQILQSVGIVPDDVISIALEHHEESSGQGFPRRVKGVRMHPLAKVVALANHFCELTVKNRNAPVVRNPKEAIEFLEKTADHMYASDLMAALESIFLQFSVQKSTG